MKKEKDPIRKRRENIIGLLAEMDDRKLASVQNILVLSLMFDEEMRKCSKENPNRETMN